MEHNEVLVLKLNPKREETWRYTGKVLRRTANSILLEARFNRSDFLFNGVLLKQNDRFVEIYFNDRWYNIFEIHDREDDSLKAWYCNVTLPAEFENGTVSYVDMALDLLVFPDGRQLVLDEDEFEALHLNQNQQQNALAALEELKLIFKDAENFRLDVLLEDF